MMSLLVALVSNSQMLTAEVIATFFLFISSMELVPWATVATEQEFLVLRGAVKTKVVLAIVFFDLVDGEVWKVLSEDVEVSYSANSEEAFKIINNKVSYCLFITLRRNHLVVPYLSI